MVKVAQGWVLNWSAPQRLPSDAAAALERAESAVRQTGNRSPAGLMPALSQVADQTVEASVQSAVQSAAAAQSEQQPAEQQPAAYSVEMREKAPKWHQLATSRERSLLLKDLKPGSEYIFRVVAHSASGLRGSPSADFRYQIPDNRRKPGGTQALSAGVVSGVLFFIACIVIAVCGVNMCNKRRKKRAEKGS